MEKVKIDLYISDLLYSYDCVIVPDFGGFVANYASAKLQAVQHKLHPPSKRISFNRQLQNNDGLLTNHIAGKREISYSEAKDLVKSFVTQSTQELNAGDHIKIEKVGTLFLDAEKNIQFIAENKTNYLLDSFGLESFRALPIQREGAEERIKEKINQQKPLIREEARKNKSKFSRIAAAAALFGLIGLSAIFLQIKFNWLNNSSTNYSALNLNFNAKKPTYQPKELSFEIEKIAPFGKIEHAPLKEGIFPFVTATGEMSGVFVDNRKEKTEAKKDNTFVSKSLHSLGLSYHVVGGCFSSEENAQTFYKQIQKEGFEARLLGSYKKYQAVSLGSFNSRKEAINLLAKVRNQDHPKAWLLIKPY